MCSKRAFPKVDDPVPNAVKPSQSSKSSEPSINVPLASCDTPKAAQALEDPLSYQAGQPSYSDLQNTLQERINYDQQQSYTIQAESSGHHVNFAPGLLDHSAHLPQHAAQHYSHHAFGNESHMQGMSNSQSRISVNPLIGNVSADGQYGVPNYSASSTFNNHFVLPLQNAMQLPNNLFLPSFASLTSEPSASTHQPPFPPSQSASSEKPAYAITGVLQGSSHKGSDGGRQPNGWTPTTSSSNAQQNSEANHGCLTIVSHLS